jgi:transposase
MTTVEGGLNVHRYWDLASCQACALKPQRTPRRERRIRRWEHEAVIEAMQVRLERRPDAMRVRRATVEHVFGTLTAANGRHPLQNPNPAEGTNRDEPPRPGL